MFPSHDQYEAGIRNVPDSVQNTILSTVDIDDDRKVENILGDLDLGRLDTKDPSRAIDVFENIVPNPAVAQRNFQTGLPGANLPNVGSTRSTVPEDQARAIVNLVGGTPPLTNVEKGLQQNQQALMAQRGRALGPINFDDDLANFNANVRNEITDTIFDPDTYKGPRKDIPNVGMIGGRRDPKFTTTDDTDPDRDCYFIPHVCIKIC